MHNKWVHQLLAQELPKDTNKLTEPEKEALQKQQCQQMLLVGVSNIKKDLNSIIQPNQNEKKHDDSKHMLLDKIGDTTKFYLARIPNQDCLNFGIATSQVSFVH